MTALTLCWSRSLAICEQDGFFNYGAASDRWIPRDQRARPASAHAHLQAPRPAPYAWENPSSAPVSTMQRDFACQFSRASVLMMMLLSFLWVPDGSVTPSRLMG